MPHARTRTNTSPGAGRRIGHVTILEHLGAAEAVEDDRLHSSNRTVGSS